MKNCKTFYEAQTVSRLKEIIQPTLNLPPPGKILLRLWNKNFPAEIYRNIQTFASRKRVSVSENVLHCTVSWHPETASSTSRNGAVQMLFLTPDRNMFSGRFIMKGSEGVLAVLRGHVVLNVKGVEICKISKIFWAKLYCKIGDLFR